MHGDASMMLQQAPSIPAVHQKALKKSKAGTPLNTRTPKQASFAEFLLKAAVYRKFAHATFKGTSKMKNTCKAHHLDAGAFVCGRLCGLAA